MFPQGIAPLAPRMRARRRLSSASAGALWAKRLRHLIGCVAASCDSMGYSYAAFATYPDRETAQAALVELPDFGLGATKIKLFECQSSASQARILDGLMSNCTWAESDGRRGLRIGVGLGASLGFVCGGVVWALLDMSWVSGLICGAFMGTLIGAVMSGIVGAGLVNPRLARTVRALQSGQVLVSISCRTREEHHIAMRLLRTGSLLLETDRPRRASA